MLVLKKNLVRFLDLLYPPSCLSCSKKVTKANTFCATCWGNISFISSPYCIKCALPLPVADHGQICHICYANPPIFDRARSVFRYDDYTRPLIHDFKFHDKTVAACSFATLMSIHGKQLISLSDLIIPVPLTKNKLAQRQYSQSALLAKHIATINSKPIKLDILNKHFDTKNQIHLTKQERQKNLTYAFKCANPKVIANKNILLVDDVLTTGATANACAKILKQAGAARVFILTLARTY